MDDSSSPLPALGRVLLAVLFIVAGFHKIGAVAATVHSMQTHGIPDPHILVWGVVALEFGGGILLAIGLMTRFVASLFFFYVLALAILFHGYWAMTGAAAHAQQSAFFEHLAIMGGMLYAAAFGPGAYSLDSLIWRDRRPATAPQPAQ